MSVRMTLSDLEWLSDVQILSLPSLLLFKDKFEGKVRWNTTQRILSLLAHRCVLCQQNSTCRYNVSAVGATDTGYVSIPVGDELALMEAVATVGPVSAAIDASQQSFMLYNSGI